jgi:hypothetical protein
MPLMRYSHILPYSSQSVVPEATSSLILFREGAGWHNGKPGGLAAEASQVTAILGAAVFCCDM